MDGHPLDTPFPVFPTKVEGPRTNDITPYDYAREQIAALRADVKDRFDHETAYRKQYGSMVADTYTALAEKGWVTLTLAQMRVDIDGMKKGQNRIFITAFSLLITMLTLLATVIFTLLKGD